MINIDVHITEIQAAVNKVRDAGIGPSSFTDMPPEGAALKAVQITGPRQNLNTAMSTATSILGLMNDGHERISSGVLIHAIDFQELRNRVK